MRQGMYYMRIKLHFVYAKGDQVRMLRIRSMQGVLLDIPAQCEYAWLHEPCLHRHLVSRVY